MFSIFSFVNFMVKKSHGRGDRSRVKHRHHYDSSSTSTLSTSNDSVCCLLLNVFSTTVVTVKSFFDCFFVF